MTQQEKFTELAKLEKQLKSICKKIDNLSIKVMRTDPNGEDTTQMYHARYWIYIVKDAINLAKIVNSPF